MPPSLPAVSHAPTQPVKLPLSASAFRRRQAGWLNVLLAGRRQCMCRKHFAGRNDDVRPANPNSQEALFDSQARPLKLFQEVVPNVAVLLLAGSSFTCAAFRGKIAIYCARNRKHVPPRAHRSNKSAKSAKQSPAFPIFRPEEITLIEYGAKI